MSTYDLSHPLESDMPVFPGDRPVLVDRTATIAGDGYETRRLTLGSHSGTHVDAPSHMTADGETIDGVALEEFRFEAVIADPGPLGPRASIDEQALRDAMPATDGVDLVVVRTGWESHWGSARYFEHPYLTAGAAEAIRERGCHLGIDAPNVDPTRTENAGPDEPDGYPAHRALFDDGRVIVENLRGLDRLPDRFELHAYPLPIRDGDASPVRAVAVVD